MSHHRSRKQIISDTEKSENKSVAVGESGLLNMIKNNSGMIMLTLSLIIILIVVLFFMYKKGSDDKLEETKKKCEELDMNNKQMMQYINAFEVRMQPQPEPEYNPETYKRSPRHKQPIYEDESLKSVIDDVPEESEESEEEEEEPTIIDTDTIINALKSPEKVED